MERFQVFRVKDRVMGKRGLFVGLTPVYGYTFGDAA